MEKFIKIGSGTWGPHWGRPFHVVEPGGLIKTANVDEFHPRIARYLTEESFSDNDLTLVVVPLGAFETWGCFPAGSGVMTRRGEVSIEEVKVGEYVLTHKNRWRPVLKKFVRKHEMGLVNLTVAGLPRLDPALAATSDHEVRVVRRDEFIRKRRKFLYERDTHDVPISEGREQFISELAFDWVPVGDLQHGDQVVQPFPLEEDSPLAAVWGDDDFAFLMGLYAAEGCVSDRHDSDMLPETDPTYNVIYIVSEEETEVIKRVVKCGEKFGRVVTPRDVGNHAIRMELHWADFARLCRDHIGRLAVEKKLSLDILTMPRSWQRTFFDSYAAGDGCVRGPGKGEGGLRCTTASYDLARSMRVLVARLGWVGQIDGRHNRKSNFYNGNPIYDLSISGSQFFGEATHVEGCLHPDGFIISPVRNVAFDEWEGEVFNLEVEEDNSYVVRGLVVHNCNVNGDAFERRYLEPENPEWGHKSFETYANAFQHHQNKVSERGFGRVPVAVYEKLMQRVEGVFRIDRSKAERVGAGWVLQKIDEGLPVDLSMGAKVKYDICSICGQQSKSISAYCTHLKSQMAQILPDGRIVCAYNPWPRFFDLSFVLLRAAKEAAILQKVASSDAARSMTEFLDNYVPLDTPQAFEKAASSKVAKVKLAELEKRFPAVYYQIVRPLYQNEESLPKGLLERLSSYSFPEILSSTAASGIVLRPPEFQHLYLSRNGHPDLAGQLLHDGRVFDCGQHNGLHNGGISYLLRDGDISMPVLRELADWIPRRSVLQPFVSRRIVITLESKPMPKVAALKTVRNPVLDEVAGEYAKYINGMASLPSFLKSAMLRQGDLFDMFAAADFNPMEKVSGFKSDTLIPAMALILPTYLLAAKWNADQRAGRDLSLLQRFVADHPILTSVGLLTGYHGSGLGKVLSGVV